MSNSQPPNQSPAEALHNILKLIYGPNVVENAYASPAGRLTLAEARTRLTAYAATVEREAARKARIDEHDQPYTYQLDSSSSDDYKAGFRDAIDQTIKISERRIAALQGPQDAEGQELKA